MFGNLQRTDGAADGTAETSNRICFAWTLSEMLPVPEGWRSLMTRESDGTLLLDGTRSPTSDARLRENFIAEVCFRHVPYQDGRISLALETAGIGKDADSLITAWAEYDFTTNEAGDAASLDDLSTLTHTTVLLMAAAAGEDLDQEIVNKAFELCLNMTHWTVDGLNSVTGRGWVLPRPESEHLGVPMWVERLTFDHLEPIASPGLLLFSSWRHEVAELSEREVTNLPYAQLESAQGHPYALVSRLKSEAVGALRRLGDSRTAIVMAQSTCEAWLDLMLCALLWDEGLTPEAAAKEITGCDTTLRRVHKLLKPRLGGSGWDDSQPGPFRDWRTNVADLRNFVIHGGFTPPIDMADQAISGMFGLLKFTLDRLCADKALSCYRMAALIIARRAALEARDAWTKKMRDAADEADQLDFQGVFARWFYAVASLRYNDAFKRSPTTVGAVPKLVWLVDGRKYWVLHDEGAAKATLAAANSDDMRYLLETLKSVDHKGSMTITFDKTPRLATSDHWLPDYMLLPNVAIMRDPTLWPFPPAAPHLASKFCQS